MRNTDRPMATDDSRLGPVTEREPRLRDSSPDYTVAVSPAQLAAGAAILAGLIVLVARRRRRRTRA